jgi:hypothetical protein
MERKYDSQENYCGTEGAPLSGSIFGLDFFVVIPSASKGEE